MDDKQRIETVEADERELLERLQTIKDFILGFTARDVDKEWQAFRFVRTFIGVKDDQIAKERQKVVEAERLLAESQKEVELLKAELEAR